MTEVKEGAKPPEPTGLAKLKDSLVNAPFGGVQHQAFNDFLDRTAAEIEADSGFSLTSTATKLDRDTVKENGRQKLALLQLQTSRQGSTLMGYRPTLEATEEAYQTAKNEIPQDRESPTLRDELLYKKLREFQSTLGTDKAQSFDFFDPKFLGKDFEISGKDTQEYINQLIQKGIISKPTTIAELTGSADPEGVFKLGHNEFELVLETRGLEKVRAPLETQGDFILSILNADGNFIPYVAPFAIQDDTGSKESNLELLNRLQPGDTSLISLPLSAIDEKTVAETPFLLKGVQNADKMGGNYSKFNKLLAEPNTNPRIKAVIESARK